MFSTRAFRIWMILALFSAASLTASARQTPPNRQTQQEATQPPGAVPLGPTPESAHRPTPAPTAPPDARADAAPDGVAQSLGAVLQPKAVPPLPSLTRPGIAGDYALPLSLNEAIRRALENNNDIEVARDDVRLAEANLRVLRGVYDPFFTFAPQFSNSVTPQADTLGGSDQSGTVSQTDLKVLPSYTRLFERGGGQFQMFFNNLRQTSSSTFNQLNPIYSASFGVTWTQPLWRDRSIDRNRREIRIQHKRLAQTDVEFRRRATEVIARVQRAYWELVFALRDQQNRVYNLNLVREQMSRTELRIESGGTAPIERAEVLTELAGRESEVLLAVRNVAVVENRLKRLILPEQGAPEWEAQFIPTDEPSFDEAPVPLADAVREARANRPELRRLQLQDEINDIDIAFYRNQARPRFDLQATVSTTGLAGSPVVATGQPAGGGVPQAGASLLSQINQLRAAQRLPAASVPVVTPQNFTVPENMVGGYGRMLRNLFGFGTRNVVVGVTIQLPVHNTAAKANLAVVRIQREQMAATRREQEQAIISEVRDAVQNVETAALRVISTRAARANAEVQLAGEQRLYQVGNSTTFLLFQRENQLANARNLELRAVIDYNLALADLQLATSTILRSNNVIIETPTEP